MNLNWTKAARSMTKYQLGLMLVLVGSTLTPSPAQAGLDEKSEVLAEWLVDLKIETQPDLTTAPQRATATVFRGTHWLSLLPTQPIGHPLLRPSPGS